MTSVLVQAVVVTDMLVLNGWHLSPSFLNTAGTQGGRHSSAFSPRDGFFVSPGTAGRAFTPKPLGTSVFHLRKVELTCHLLTHALESPSACFSHSLPENAQSGKDHLPHLEARKQGGLSAWHRYRAHPSCSKPRAPSLQRGVAAGSTFHTSSRKKFGRFSKTVGKNGHKVTPFSTRHGNSLVHKGSMDGIKALLNC